MVLPISNGVKKIIIGQFWILLLGTLFAWGNFVYELVNWLQGKACITGCVPEANPFLTPCFYGAIFFTIAFILSVILFRSKD